MDEPAGWLTTRRLGEWCRGTAAIAVALSVAACSGHSVTASLPDGNVPTITSSIASASPPERSVAVARAVELFASLAYDLDQITDLHAKRPVTGCAQTSENRNSPAFSDMRGLSW